MIVPAEALVPWLDQLSDHIIVERRPVPPIPSDVALRCDGRPVTESVADRALTTPEILAQRSELIAWTARRLGL